jgi:hypothetical protein
MLRLELQSGAGPHNERLPEDIYRRCISFAMKMGWAHDGAFTSMAI